jgi:hypothetical protein
MSHIIDTARLFRSEYKVKEKGIFFTKCLLNVFSFFVIGLPFFNVLGYVIYYKLNFKETISDVSLLELLITLLFLFHILIELHPIA